MGVTLFDRKDDDHAFSINFWHWRAIVEVVRRLELLPPATVDGLHEPFCGNGLSRVEAMRVAEAIDTTVLPSLTGAMRVLLDGTTTEAPDDGRFNKGDEARNYSTNRDVLQGFAKYCRTCSGFDVM